VQEDEYFEWDDEDALNDPNMQFAPTPVYRLQWREEQGRWMHTWCARWGNWDPDRPVKDDDEVRCDKIRIHYGLINCAREFPASVVVRMSPSSLRVAAHKIRKQAE
jgi:hypothetical protein